MARPWSDMMWDLRNYWRNFIWQSLLAAGSIFLILIILDMNEAVIIASLGATAFVVFALPEQITAQPRNVIGGHFVGLLCGMAGIGLLQFIPESTGSTAYGQYVIYAFAVGLAIFVMTVFDTEHPPAAGTAMGVVMKDFSPQIMVQVMIFAIIFSAIRYVLRRHLRDLTYLPRSKQL